ncbi:MAG: hypothetical protein RSE64_06095 [Oscillospiraceae bacterium]
MKKLMHDKRGGVPIIFIGLLFFLLLITAMIMELGAAYENYYDAETILQRCCNSAVEKNISDEKRSDHILYLDVEGAKTDFKEFVNTDMVGKYAVHISSITGNETPPSLAITGSITFSTLFAQYNFDDVSFDFKVRATNYGLE